MTAAKTRTIDVLATGYELVEAPVTDGHGGLFFTDARSGIIYYRAPDGHTQVLDRDRIVGGMVRHRNGSLVLSGPTIAERSADGTWVDHLTIPNRQGTQATINDIVALPDGSVVGGTLQWPQRSDGTRVAADLYAPDAIDGQIWRLRSGGRSEIVYQSVGISNGVEVAADAESILFADTKNQRVLHLRIMDGPFELLTEISTKAVGKPDGLAADAEGCVWVAVMDGGVVARYSADGELLETVDLPARKVTSLCFLEAEPTLIVGTGTVDGLHDQGGSIFRIDVDVPGAPVYSAAI